MFGFSRSRVKSNPQVMYDTRPSVISSSVPSSSEINGVNSEILKDDFQGMPKFDQDMYREKIGSVTPKYYSQTTDPGLLDPATYPVNVVARSDFNKGLNRPYNSSNVGGKLYKKKKHTKKHHKKGGSKSKKHHKKTRAHRSRHRRRQ